MEKDNLYYSQGKSVSSLSHSFMANVFIWMSAGLVMTAALAYLFASNDFLLSLLFDQNRQRTGLGYVVLFSPLVFAFLMPAIDRISYGALVICFMAYSAIMGMSLSVLLLIYTSSSIYSIFLITAGMFAVTAVYGYTTKSDLTKIGNILIMAMFGIVIASLVNFFFIKSGFFSYIISIVCVVIFTGLTAYNVQMLKDIYNDGTEKTAKLAIIGALNLYICFINLFISLLNLFGDRRD